MKKRLRDDELKEWLEKEVEKENIIMEDALFSRVRKEREEITDEELNSLYHNLAERIMVQEDMGKDETGRKKRIFRKSPRGFFSGRNSGSFGRSLSRAAAFVVVCALAVFAASMTTEANRNYFMDSVKYWTGNDTKILIDNDVSNDKPSLDEEQARDEIEEEVGVEVPEFMYRPDTFEFHKYEITPESGIVNLQYWYKDNVVSLYISDSSARLQSNSLSVREDSAEIVYAEKGELPVTIMETQEEKGVNPIYLAEWEWEGHYYQLSAGMPKQIFEKIIKEIIFLA